MTFELDWLQSSSESRKLWLDTKISDFLIRLVLATLVLQVQARNSIFVLFNSMAANTSTSTSDFGRSETVLSETTGCPPQYAVHASFFNYKSAVGGYMQCVTNRFLCIKTRPIVFSAKKTILTSLLCPWRARAGLRTSCLF